MKILAAVMALFAVIYFLPAFTSRTDEVSGKNRVALYKSAVKVKRYMPTDERVLFDTSMGIIDKIKTQEAGPDAFVAAVDGKTPEEVIALAKQEVTVKIAAGDPEFKKYTSWEDMVAKLTDDGHRKTVKPSEPEEVPLRNYSREGRPE